MKNGIKTMLLAVCVALLLMGCGDQVPEETSLTTQPTTQEGNQAPETETTGREINQTTDAEADQPQEVSAAVLDEFLFNWAEQYWADEEQERSCRISVTELCTPVILELEELTVKNIQAYGRTLEVNAGPDEGDIAFSLEQWQDALVINGEDGCWLITQEQTYDFPVADGVETWMWVNENEELEYHKYASAAEWMEQTPGGPLDFATDRGNLYSEDGTVELQDGQLVLNMKDRTLVGHVFDLDALFTLNQIMEWNDYQGCESADDVLKQNKEEGGTWLTYPYESKEPAQRVEFEGLTLELPQRFAEEQREENLLVLRGEELGYEDLVINVTTGDAQEGYQGVDTPITAPEQMLDWDRETWGGESVASFTLHDALCLFAYGDQEEHIRGYYVKDNRWWVVEVENMPTESLLMYASCGITE